MRSDGQLERKEKFEDLYRAHADDVLAYARRRTATSEAEEVVADTFLVAWRRLDSVPLEPLPWLYQVARRTLANRRRSIRRRDSLTMKISRFEARQELTGDPAENFSDPHWLVSALARLSERDREVLMLIAWEGLDHHAAAIVLECSRSALAVRLHRARKRLAKELASGGHEQVWKATSNRSAEEAQ